MKMEHPEEEVILYDGKDRDYDVINKDEVDCARVRWQNRDIVDLWKEYNYSGITRTHIWK